MAARARSRRPGGGIRGREGIAGWVFTAPMIVILGVFLFIPMLMALYVSLTSWNGNGSPFAGGQNARFVGLDNYSALFTRDGLTRDNFMQSLGNNFYYVVFVVPLQTATSFFLALVVSNRFLKGKSFFRTAFYFPVGDQLDRHQRRLPLPLPELRGGQRPAGSGRHRRPGVVQRLTRPVPHRVRRLRGRQPGLGQRDILGRSIWEWISGPSVAMCVIIVLAIWTTTGTFMLIFLAALQDLPVEVDEAAMLDGVGPWQKLRHVTLPMIKPTLFLVITLGLIGTWQVFDQIYVMGKGAPAGTTLTPAYLSYQESFRSLKYGTGAAMAFIVFVIIVAADVVPAVADGARTGAPHVGPGGRGLASAVGPSRARQAGRAPRRLDPRRSDRAPATGWTTARGVCRAGRLRGDLPLPLPHPDRDVVQDRPATRPRTPSRSCRTRSTWAPGSASSACTATPPCRSWAGWATRSSSPWW